MVTKIIDGFFRHGNLCFVSESQYEKTSKDFKGVWEYERWDIPNWAEVREKYMGKRTIMPPFSLFDTTCLLIDGLSMEIVSDERFNELVRSYERKKA